MAELWPDGPQRLIGDLNAQGFEAEASSEVIAQLSKAWDEIKNPCASDHLAIDRSHYGYATSLKALRQSQAWGLLFVDRSLKISSKDFQHRLIAVKNPDAAIDFILRQVSTSEWSGTSGPVPENVKAEAQVVIGPDTVIGAGTVLEAGVRLGARVTIGPECRIGANTRIGDDCVLGKNCQLTSSVSIGGQGFGFVKYPNEKSRRPRLHVGRVIIGDHVRIGSFVGIDRGVFDDTLIGSGTALDNFVQIAHNCRVGENGILCAFVGLSGKTYVGNGVTIAGLSGTNGHVNIGDNVTIAAQSGINCDIEDNATVKGYPPRPLSTALKIQVLVAKLPEIYERLKKLERS